METDPDTGEYIGPGYVLGLDFNTAPALNADFATLAAGTCTGAETYESFIFTTRDEESYLMQYDADGNSTLTEVAGGSVAVSIVGEGITVSKECSSWTTVRISPVRTQAKLRR